MAIWRTLNRQKTVLFVCTGTICRSPMAEGLFGRMIAERPDLRVLSAGVSTYPGQPPSAHAVEVLAELGVDISQHRSRPLSEKVIDEADWIIAMTRSHLDSIIYLFPRAAEKVYLLREFEPGATSLDVADPIGMGLEAYRAARDIIRNGLPGLMQFIDQARSGAFSNMNRNPHNRSLEEVDPEIFHAIEAERIRQFENIELIASENFTSRAVMEAQGSVLTNKYAEGYPGRRWYGGCEHVDVVEQLAIDRVKQLFGAANANVQPNSGSQANQGVFFGLLQPGDTIMGMSLAEGGHLTHGMSLNMSGKWFKVVSYGLDEKEAIDYDQMEKLAHESKPKLIIAGASAYSLRIDFERFAKVAKAV